MNFKLNLFKHYQEVPEKQSVGRVQTCVFLLGLVFAVAIIISVLATRTSRGVFQISQPTLQEYFALYNENLRPQCDCSNSFFSVDTFVQLSYVMDGWCLVVEKLAPLCEKLPALCNQALFPGSTTTIYRYELGILADCQLAQDLIDTTVTQIKSSHFSSVYLLTAEQVQDNVNTLLNSTFHLMALGFKQPFIITEFLFDLEEVATRNAYSPTTVPVYTGAVVNGTIPSNAKFSAGTGLVESNFWKSIDAYQTQLAASKGLSTPACTCETDIQCSAPIMEYPFSKYNYSQFCFVQYSGLAFPSALFMDPDLFRLYGAPPNLLQGFSLSQFKYPTFGDSLYNAFLANYTGTVNYAAYFNQCSPSQCVYFGNQSPSAIELLSTLLGLLGGLSLVLRALVMFVGELFFIRQAKQRQQQQLKTAAIEEPNGSVMLSVMSSPQQVASSSPTTATGREAQATQSPVVAPGLAPLPAQATITPVTASTTTTPSPSTGTPESTSTPTTNGTVSGPDAV